VVWCRGRLTSRTARTIVCDMEICAEDGTILSEIRGLVCQALSGQTRQSDSDRFDDWTYQYVWTEQPREARQERIGRWVVFVDRQGVAERLTVGMAQAGVRDTVTVQFGDTFVAVPGERYMIRRDVPSDLERLKEQVGTVDGITFLNGLDAGVEGSDPVAMQAGCEVLAAIKCFARAAAEKPPRVFVITRAGHCLVDTDVAVNPAQGTLLGINRVAFNELEGMQCTSIDLDLELADDIVAALAAELVSNHAEDEVALRPGLRFASILRRSDILSGVEKVQLDAAQGDRFSLVPGARSDTGRPVFRQAAPTVPGVGEIEIAVHAAHVTKGFLEGHGSEGGRSQASPGMTVAGVITAVGSDVEGFAAGEGVCGLVPGTLATHVTARLDNLSIVRSTATVSDADLAASVLLQARAIHMVRQARIAPDQTVLVHADLNGLAFIQAARQAGATVIAIGQAMLGKDAPRQYGADHVVWDVKDLDGVIETVTGGAGFDVMAVPMARWCRFFDFSVLVPGGCVVNTEDAAGHGPVVLDDRIGAFVQIGLETLTTRYPELLRTAMAAAVEKLGSGRLKALPSPTLSLGEFGGSDLHEGISADSFTLVLNAPQEQIAVQAFETLPITSDATYLITGGFGGLGREFANWLIENGAKHLVLVGRRGAADDDARSFVRQLENRGAVVMAASCDIADHGQLKDLMLQIAGTMPPLRGVMHTAAVLEDKALLDLNGDDFDRVMMPKAVGAWNLHVLTQDVPLDFFVLCSSVSSLVGNSRQTNYVAANNFLDALAWHRRLEGLAATSVNWGAIADVGIITRDAAIQKHLEYTGLISFPVADALQALGRILHRHPVQVGVAKADWRKWARYEHLGGQSPRFAELVGSQDADDAASSKSEIKAKLLAVAPEDRQDVVTYLLSEIFAHDLRMSANDIDIHRPLNRMGVDSLMGAEIQLRIESVLAVKVSTIELVGDGTVSALAAKCLDQIGISDQPMATAA
jgi:NADPH:quinone reductase-like Zn-dependent oxidoreductase/NAD(P)-dependent dehydrogenase (short-subunit alcohol dehydrogenase family)